MKSLMVLVILFFAYLQEQEELERLFKKLSSTDQRLREKAIDQLVKLGEKFKEDLQKRSNDPAIGSDLKYVLKIIAMKQRLGNHFWERMPEVLKLLAEKDFDRRFRVLEKVLGDKFVKPRYYVSEDELDLIVGELVSGTSRKKQAKVVEFLRESGSHIVGKAVLRFLSSRDSSIRGTASWVLQNLGKKKYAPRVAELLKHKNVGVRRDAVLLLGNLGAKEYVKDIIPLLFDDKEDHDLPGWVAIALANLGAKEALKPLKKRLRTAPCPWTRQQIKEAIRRIKSLNKQR